MIYPWIFASLNATGETVGIYLGSLNGIAVWVPVVFYIVLYCADSSAYFDSVVSNAYTYSYDTTEVYITVSRSTLVKTYVITIVATMCMSP